MYADEPGRNDPFAPPDEAVEVECIHCGETYMSDKMLWRPDRDDPDLGGDWCCPTSGCDGVGFGFDVHPVGTFGDEPWDGDDDEDDENEDDETNFPDELFGEDTIELDSFVPGLTESEPAPPAPSEPRDDRKDRRMKQMGLDKESDSPRGPIDDEDIPF